MPIFAAIGTIAEGIGSALSAVGVAAGATAGTTAAVITGASLVTGTVMTANSIINAVTMPNGPEGINIPNSLTTRIADPSIDAALQKAEQDFKTIQQSELDKLATEKKLENALIAREKREQVLAKNGPVIIAVAVVATAFVVYKSISRKEVIETTMEKV